MIRKNKIGLVYLIEIWVKEVKANLIRAAIAPDWGFAFNYEKHFLGRIWVCWNKDGFDVNILAKSDQSISCVVKNLKENFSWY